MVRAGGELETRRIRFYAMPPRGVEWPYLLVNHRNYNLAKFMSSRYMRLHAEPANPPRGI